MHWWLEKVQAVRNCGARKAFLFFAAASDGWVVEEREAIAAVAKAYDSETVRLKLKQDMERHLAGTDDFRNRSHIERVCAVCIIDGFDGGLCPGWEPEIRRHACLDQLIQASLFNGNVASMVADHLDHARTHRLERRSLGLWHLGRTEEAFKEIYGPFTKAIRVAWGPRNRLPAATRKLNLTTILQWNDGTVRRMAENMYEYNAFDTMPILADALEDAGCSDRFILKHCRRASWHAKGCWVVDLLLGKE